MKPAQGAARRLRWMYDNLLAAYGPQHWWPAQTPFEVVVGAYLTQNTAWSAVERSLQNLRAADALSLEGLRSFPIHTLQELIRPSGFATRKAPALKAFVTLLDERYGGQLAEMSAAPAAALRKELLALPGVGPETADAILLYALGQEIPMADEYLRRIVGRHGLLKSHPQKNRAGYEALVELTRQGFNDGPVEDKRQLYNEFHALTVTVGKAHCKKVAACSGCPLQGDPHTL